MLLRCSNHITLRRHDEALKWGAVSIDGMLYATNKKIKAHATGRVHSLRASIEKFDGKCVSVTEISHTTHHYS